MFNYYWQERAFYNATVDETSRHLQEINDILSVADHKDHFYRNTKFTECSYGKKLKIFDLLYSYIPDMQLKMRVLPLLMQRFQVTDRSYVEPKQMYADFPKQYNALLGPRFVNVQNSKCFIVTKTDYLDFREDILINCVDVKNFETFCTTYLRHIVITQDAFKQAKFHAKDISKVYIDLVKLDDYIQKGLWRGRFNWIDVGSQTGIDISDESDSTKQDPKLSHRRHFVIPGIGGKDCYIHIKPGSIRMHIYPDDVTKIVHVPYIGRHLPTKRFG